MTPAEMVKAAAAEGVMVSKTPQGGILLKGGIEAVNRWSTALKSRKSDLVSYLNAEKALLDWLHLIEEDDPQIIKEVLSTLQNDQVEASYFLHRADKAFKTYEKGNR